MKPVKATPTMPGNWANVLLSPIRIPAYCGAISRWLTAKPATPNATPPSASHRDQRDRNHRRLRPWQQDHRQRPKSEGAGLEELAHSGHAHPAFTQRISNPSAEVADTEGRNPRYDGIGPQPLHRDAEGFVKI